MGRRKQGDTGGPAEVREVASPDVDDVRLGVVYATSRSANLSQGRRVIAVSHRLDPAELATICADDIPGQLLVEDSPPDQQLGQYL